MDRVLRRVSLHARLRAGSVSAWRCLGAVTVVDGQTVLDGVVRFEEGAAHLAPLWRAAQPGLLDGPVVVELGVLVDGRIQTVGSTRVTPALAGLVRDPAPVRVNHLPGGPRPVRSRWPRG